MSRPGVFWLVLAGSLSIVRWALDFADIQYYDPESLLDYSGVILQTSAGLATGVALLLLWQSPSAGRAAIPLALAGIASIAQGLGNLFEDAFGWEWGVWGFFIGGVGMVVMLALAGALAMTGPERQRLVGALLILGATGGMLGLGLLIMGLSWIALAIWVSRNLASPSVPSPKGG